MSKTFQVIQRVVGLLSGKGPALKRRRGRAKQTSSRLVALESVRNLAERFLGLLQSEIEKVSLFALARVGELSDTVGVLRFGSSRDLGTSEFRGEEAHIRRHNQNHRHHHHNGDSASSNGSSDNEDIFTSDEDESPVGHFGGGGYNRRKTQKHKNRHHHLQSTPGGFASSTIRESQFQDELDETNNPRNNKMLFSDRILGEDQSFLVSAVDEADAYTQVGTELLHLLRFICVNAMAARKILKKHDKLMSNQLMGNDTVHSTTQFSCQKLQGGADAHLRAMVNSAGISAVTASLMSALSEFQTAHNRAEEINRTTMARATENISIGGLNNLGGGSFYHSLAVKLESVQSGVASPLEIHIASGGNLAVQDNAPITRLRDTVYAIQTVRTRVETAYIPFEAFLSRRAFAVTGSKLGDVGGASLEALTFMLKYDPSTAASHPSSFGSNMSDSEKEGSMREEKGADLSSLEIGIEAMSDPKQDNINGIINLMSIFLYTTNYYIISPTANSYAELCGEDSSYSGALIGASSISAFFGAFLYSVWSTKGTYKSALLFSAVMPLLGNLLYAYAITPQSIQVAYMGRLLVGFGSCEVCNRGFITQTVSLRNMTSACARFVAASAIGMSFGPLVAGILDEVSGRDTNVDIPIFGGLMVNHVTAPAWFMAAVWTIQIGCCWFLFVEPEQRRHTGGGGGGGILDEVGIEQGLNKSQNIDVMGKGMRSSTGDEADKEGLLSSNNQRGYGSTINIGGGDTSYLYFDKTNATFLTKLRHQVKLTHHLVFSNIAFPVMLLLFASIEIADEVLINSVGLITHRYFRWHGSTAGFFVASLGVFVLPANFIIEQFTRLYDDRQIIRFCLWFCFVGVLGLLNFRALLGYPEDERVIVPFGDTTDMSASNTFTRSKHEYDGSLGKFQFVTGVAWVFTGSIMLEGVVTSCMAKSAPNRLESTFLNAGLMATLIGTIGRIVADSFIVGAGIAHSEGWDFVNSVFLQLALVFGLGLLIVTQNYYNLAL